MIAYVSKIAYYKELTSTDINFVVLQQDKVKHAMLLSLTLIHSHNLLTHTSAGAISSIILAARAFIIVESNETERGSSFTNTFGRNRSS